MPEFCCLFNLPSSLIVLGHLHLPIEGAENGKPRKLPQIQTELKENYKSM